MIKVSVILKRKPGLSPAEFRRYWKEVHGPLLLGVPEVMRYVRKYVQCHSIADAFSDIPGVSSEYDGIAELWGDRIDDVTRGLAEPRYAEVIRPDEEKFLDLGNCVFMVTEEVPMKRTRPATRCG
jgi:uncharacterized protein (TIGR02118 family)